LHGGQYNAVIANADGLAFRIDDSTFPYPPRAHACVTFMMECVLINLHALACTLAGTDLTANVLRIETRRSEPAEDAPTGFWTCPVVYGASAFSIVYAPALANHSVRDARPREEEVHNRVLSLIEKRERGGESVSVGVRQALRDGLRDQYKVAQRLNCSV